MRRFRHWRSGPGSSHSAAFGHYKQTEHFVRVVRGEEEPVVRRAEALNAMRILDAIYASAAEGVKQIFLD